MRILIFHGYLLSGTGSNVYNANLARALVALGHEVHLLSQERDPLALDFVDAAGDWERGTLTVRARRDPVRCTVYRPEIGRLLPLYVADRYPGIEARPFGELSDEQIAGYVAANVAAVRDVLEHARPQLALANHLVMGPLILARALAGEVPYAVKIHGSALEYVVKPYPERFLPAAREGLAGASGVLVGSRHTAESLWAALDEPGLRGRTRLGPPGVDVERFAPRPPEQAAAGLRALAARLGAAGGARASEDSFSRDASAAARALERLDPERDRLVAFVGKLMLSKGVDLLLAAWPLVLQRVPAAQLVVVGFGGYREGLEALIAALARGDLEEARAIARAGRELEGGVAAPLALLGDFLDRLELGGERDAYVRAAATLPERVVLTGRLEHDELAELLPACEAEVVPSTFPEAFGMVAIEGAACGALPLSAEHSGLAEISRVLATAVPPPAARLLSFALDDEPVEGIAERLVEWLEADPRLREATRAALVATVRERWSWQGVARGVLSAAQGRLDELPVP